MMRSTAATLAVLAIAGSALAAPSYFYADGRKVQITPDPQTRGAVVRGEVLDANADRMTLTPELVVELKAGQSAQELAAAQDLDFVRTFSIGDRTFATLRAADGVAAVERANALHENKIVVTAQPVIERRMAKRGFSLPSDPAFSSQWHLRNVGQFGGVAGEDANLEPAWAFGSTGNGVQIAIVDDGLETAHPDFASKYDAAGSFDFNDNDPDPNPESSFDRHGTAVAGVAVAERNNAAAVGAAYNATVSGIRLIAGAFSDLDEGEALDFALDRNDIYNHSWGPFDDGQRLEGPGLLASAALDSARVNGRDGKGAIIVWAGGNGGGFSNDNVNYDGYANRPDTIAVGASNNLGLRSSYSEPGACLVVNAPSDGGTAGITTSDLLGTNGYSSSDSTNTFGGTSSSSPLAAGVCALILEANPDVTYRDVQAILIDSAERNDPGNADWAQNASGRWVNHNYGFGRIDADAAVQLALEWDLLAPEIVETYDAGIASPIDIPDQPNTLSIDIEVGGSEIETIEWVELTVDITHPYRGDVEIALASPDGVNSILAEERSDFGDDIQWTFTSVRHWGDTPNGTWTLSLSDGFAGVDFGAINSATLTIRGSGPEELINICAFDFDNSGAVDGADFGIFGAAFGSSSDDPNYLPAADANGDGVIDGADFGAFGAEFGRADCLE
jgi:subtilisin-like proprotein convertase family protein